LKVVKENYEKVYYFDFCLGFIGRMQT